jgi:hypothetical protein
MRKILFSFLLAGSFFVLPESSHAIGLPFGGLETYQFPCTCSPAYMWGFFSPLFLSNPAPLTGALATPLSVGFATYVPHVGSYALGFYTPGVQACWIYVVVGCIPLPTIGAITPLTGVSGI